MKNRDLLRLAHNNNKGIKKIFLIAIITFFFLLIFIPFSFYKTYSEAVDVILNSDYDFRKIKITEDEDVKNYEKIESSLSSPHIVNILDSNFGTIQTAWIKELSAKPISIEIKVETFVPEIVLGNEGKEMYDMVCPINMAFGVFDDMNVNDLKNMEEYLNKEFVLTFPKLLYDDVKEERYFEYYDYTFRLTGLYDATNTYSYSTCYINESYFNEINLVTLPYDYNELDRIPTIYVDSYKNVPKVTKILDEHGINYFISELEIDFLDTVFTGSIILMIILSILTIIVLFVYLKVYVKERNRKLMLYKFLGFSKKDIFKLVFYSLLELFFISFVLSTLFAIIIRFILMNLLTKNVTFAILDIKLSFIPIVIYFVILILIALIVIAFNSKRIYSLTIKEEKV